MKKVAKLFYSVVALVAFIAAGVWLLTTALQPRPAVNEYVPPELARARTAAEIARLERESATGAAWSTALLTAFWITVALVVIVVVAIVAIAVAREAKKIWLDFFYAKLDATRLYPDANGNTPVALLSSGAVVTVAPGNILQPVPHHYAPHFTNSGGAGTTAAVAAPAVIANAPELPQPKLPDNAPFHQWVSQQNIVQDGELYFTLGITAQGAARSALVDLTHMLPAGKTKSGKSTFLRALTAQAIMAELAAPDIVRLCLVDLSTITFHPELFRGSKVMYEKAPDVITDEKGAIELLHTLLAECKYRAGLYGQADGYPESLPDYNRAVAPELRLPAIVTEIEEGSDLAETLREPFLSPLKRLIWTGRKFGIYLVCAGQDFRAKTIDKAIVGNSSSRFAFRQTSAETLRVLEIETAQRVTADRPGRGLMYLNGQISEIQGLYLEKRDFISLVQATKISSKVSSRPTEFEPLELVNSAQEPPELQFTTAENSQILTVPVTPELVRAVKSLKQKEGWGKNRIIEVVWGAKPGGTQAYKEASQLFDQIVSS